MRISDCSSDVCSADLVCFVTVWIDAAMAHATMAATGCAFVPMTLEIKVSFFKPAAPGLVTAEAWIEQKGRSTVFLEGRLSDAKGNILAKATSTVRLIPREKFA